MKESKNSEVIFHVNGIKKKARTVNSLISPAPTPTFKISGVRSRTDSPLSGYKSRVETTLSANRDINVIDSTRFDMRWVRTSTKDM